LVNKNNITRTGVSTIPIRLENEALQTAAATLPLAIEVNAIDDCTVEGKQHRNIRPRAVAEKQRPDGDSRRTRQAGGGHAPSRQQRGGCDGGQQCHDVRLGTVAWWQPPPAELLLVEGALALRGALRDAVAVRVRPGEVLGADLSDGMDSTSVCFLAAEAGARLVTATLHWSAPGNEDHAYAQHAAEHLPGIQRLVFSSAELPACFTGLAQRHDPADEPSAVLRDRAQQQQLADAMRARGAVRRLCGHGGDHVVLPPRLYVHTLLRRRPWSALRHTAGWRARSHWPLGATARLLLDGRSYSSWLTATSRRLRESAAVESLPQGWGKRPQLPAWASEQAEQLLAGLLRAAAQQAAPLAIDRGQHAWVEQVQEAGRIAGLIAHASTAAGLGMDSPFCDDTVVTAALAVRPDQARSPWSYKPLLAAAMDGLVPTQLLRRTTAIRNGTPACARTGVISPAGHRTLTWSPWASSRKPSCGAPCSTPACSAVVWVHWRTPWVRRHGYAIWPPTRSRPT
jgi:hypothetical protein